MERFHRIWSLTWPLLPLLLATFVFNPWSQRGVVDDTSAEITISLFGKPVVCTKIVRNTILRETRSPSYRLAVARCRFFVGFVLQTQWQLTALLLSGILIWWANWPLRFDNPHVDWPPWKSLAIVFTIGTLVVVTYQQAWSFFTGAPFAIADGGVTDDLYGYRFATLAAVNIGAWILAPISEELLFRGWLQRTLSAGVNVWIALLMQAVIFGALHNYQGISGVIQTTLLGLAAGLLYLKTGRLWTAVLVHILANLFGSLPEFVGCVMRAMAAT